MDKTDGVPRELSFAAAPSIRARMRPYHTVLLGCLIILNMAWPMFELKSGVAMAAPAAPMPPPLLGRQ